MPNFEPSFILKDEVFSQSAPLPVHCILWRARAAHAGVSSSVKRERQRQKKGTGATVSGSAFEGAVILRLIIATAKLTD